MKPLTPAEIIAIKKAQIIAIPTDTVAGLCAPVENVQAIEKLFALKQRPLSKTMMLLLPNFAAAQTFFQINPWQEKIIQANSPGQISFLLPLLSSVTLSSHLYSKDNGERIAGFRIPHSPEAQTVLSITGPLAQTSLNISGEAPITNSQTIPFAQEIDFIYPFANLAQTPSTIVHLYKDSFTILRQGKSQLAMPKTA